MEARNPPTEKNWDSSVTSNIIDHGYYERRYCIFTDTMGGKDFLRVLP